MKKQEKITAIENMIKDINKYIRHPSFKAFTNLYPPYNSCTLWHLVYCPDEWCTGCPYKPTDDTFVCDMIIFQRRNMYDKAASVLISIRLLGVLEVELEKAKNRWKRV